MPYIKQDSRMRWEQVIRDAEEHMTSRLSISKGELNYLISSICLSYVTEHGKSYSTINDIIGVLECAKMEFYRRLAAGYEDEKIKECGDVYE